MPLLTDACPWRGTNLQGTFHGLIVLRHEATYKEVYEELYNLKHHCNGDAEVE